MLYLVATPIGIFYDITLRALEILRQVDLVASEDTRKTGLLLKHFDIQKPQISFHEHNEQHVGARIEELLQQGQSVAVVSDAGTPGISDPGFTLVRRAIQAQIEVTMIPVLLPSSWPLSSQDSLFIALHFEAFHHAKRLGDKNFFWLDIELPYTLIYSESPYRLESFSRDALEFWRTSSRHRQRSHQNVRKGGKGHSFHLALIS